VNGHNRGPTIRVPEKVVTAFDPNNLEAGPADFIPAACDKGIPARLKP
jgi:hypothetical protein